jgi:predicted flap endonuclease-1-like 5' DNA nuclease
VTPEILLVALVASLALGAWAGWLLRSRRSRAQREAENAYQAEVVRAATCARDRAADEREQAVQRLARLQQEHAQCEVRLEGVMKQLRDREAVLEVLKGDLASAIEAHEDGERRSRALEAQVDALETAVDERDQQDGAPTWLAAEPDAAPDNLTAIRGLGPVLERRLNELGIYRYEQLARITPENARWIALRLQIVPGRILSDRWAEQARALHERRQQQPA